LQVGNEAALLGKDQRWYSHEPDRDPDRRYLLRANKAG